MSFVNMEDECGESFDSRPGQTYEAIDGIEGSPTHGQTITLPANGPHRCIKHKAHVKDPTNDDHKCCCGASDWVT